ncbi:MAG: GNAT family N-acetyltransferase [Caldilinea sp.]|jgi:N-acetylglutamate synthase-like GNAT family acetyltransferase
MPHAGAPVYLRSATAADQPAITALVRDAGINPMKLDWYRFVVADEGGRVVGTGQVKTHSDGAREVASIAVVPERRGQGIGRAIVATLLSLQPAPLYLCCGGHNESYYRQFGFTPLSPAAMPRSLRRIHRIGNALLRLVSLLTRQRERLVVMGQGIPDFLQQHA